MRHLPSGRRQYRAAPVSGQVSHNPKQYKTEIVRLHTAGFRGVRAYPVHDGVHIFAIGFLRARNRIRWRMVANGQHRDFGSSSARRGRRCSDTSKSEDVPSSRVPTSDRSAAVNRTYGFELQWRTSPACAETRLRFRLSSSSKSQRGRAGSRPDRAGDSFEIGMQSCVGRICRAASLDRSMRSSLPSPPRRWRGPPRAKSRQWASPTSKTSVPAFPSSD